MTQLFIGPSIPGCFQNHEPDHFISQLASAAFNPGCQRPLALYRLTRSLSVLLRFLFCVPVFCPVPGAWASLASQCWANKAIGTRWRLFYCPLRLYTYRNLLGALWKDRLRCRRSGLNLEFLGDAVGLWDSPREERMHRLRIPFSWKSVFGINSSYRVFEIMSELYNWKRWKEVRDFVYSPCAHRTRLWVIPEVRESK